MQKFDGFPDKSKLSPTAFPVLFFSDLLPMIDDLAELKVTLFCFWALHQKEGQYRYLARREFSAAPSLIEGLRAARPDVDPETILDAALARAVERGTLLCESAEVDAVVERFYFVNSERGRIAVKQLREQQWYPGDVPVSIEILPERPNIFRIYEQNIGNLTPMIADALKDAERDFPADWLEDAIRAAVENNKRSWRYILSILKRWEKEGRGYDPSKGRAGADQDVYVPREYLYNPNGGE